MRLIDFLRNLGIDVGEKMLNDAADVQKYLINNNLDDLVIGNKYGGNIYVSDVILEILMHDQWSNLEVSPKTLDRYKVAQVYGEWLISDKPDSELIDEICALSIPEVSKIKELKLPICSFMDLHEYNQIAMEHNKKVDAICSLQPEIKQ